jgi:hypothetical protein
LAGRAGAGAAGAAGAADAACAFAGGWKITRGGWKVAAGTPGGSACAGAGAGAAAVMAGVAELAGLANGVAGLLNGAANGAVAEPAVPSAALVAPPVALVALLVALVPSPVALVPPPVALVPRPVALVPEAWPVALAVSGAGPAAPAPFSLGAAAARAVLRRVRLAGRRAAPPSAWSPAAGAAVSGAAAAGAAVSRAAAAGAALSGVAAAGAASWVSGGGADPAAGLAVRRRVVRARGAAAAAVSLRPDGPLLPDPSLLDPVSCSSLSSIRAISRQAPGRGRPQRAVRSARELVARDIPAGTCLFGGPPGARYLQLLSSRRAPQLRLRCRIQLP